MARTSWLDARMYHAPKTRLSLFKYRFNINDDIDFIADDNTAAVQSSSVVECLLLSSLALSAFFGCARFFVAACTAPDVAASVVFSYFSRSPANSTRLLFTGSSRMRSSRPVERDGERLGGGVARRRDEKEAVPRRPSPRSHSGLK